MATTVEFRTGVGDKVAYAVRWLRMAAERGARVQVIGDPATLQAIDRALWADDPGDFVPHAWVHQAARSPGLERTALWFGDGEVPAPAPGLLLNVGADVPGQVERFERVVEVVGADDEDAQAGRRRWKLYQQRGLAPAHRLADGGA